MVDLCLVVSTNGSWGVFAQNSRLGSSTSHLLESIPDNVTPEYLPSLIKLLDGCSICIGNPEEEFCDLAKSRKGMLKDSSGKVVKASLDVVPFVSTCHYYKESVRTTKCEILVSSGRCIQCKAYRPTLRSLAKKSRSSKSPDKKAIETGSHWNWRYLTKPQRRERAKSRRTEVFNNH